MKIANTTIPTDMEDLSGLDIRTLVTLVASEHIRGDIGVSLIAKACNVNEDRLINAIKNSKAPRRISRWTAEEEKTIITMWNDGKTAREIGAALNRTSGSVGLRINALRSAGHKLMHHDTGRAKNAAKSVKA